MGKNLIIGASGLVGSRILARFGAEARGTYCSHARPGLQFVDITDTDTVDDEIEALRPSVVVLAAAYTHVDGCEKDPRRSYDINVAGTRNVGGCGSVRRALGVSLERLRLRRRAGRSWAC